MKLENTPAERIEALAAAQKACFRSGATRPEKFRRTMLRRFDAALVNWEKRLCEALWQDLHKSYEEAMLTELSIVRGEIRQHLRHLRAWMRPESRPTPLKLLPSKSRILAEPLGQALIVAPWNYPVQLLLNPLVGAISAGCTAMLKPSPYTPTVARTIEAMIREIFDEEYVAVVQGNREVNRKLFELRWDVIFFTGSPDLGRQVMEAAARHLTPVVLELGGKSPCIVDRGADIDVAARRIAWGKTLNAGQTCIAPDYLLIHRSLQEPFVKAYKEALQRLHGEDARQSPYYVRLVNDRAFERVAGYIPQGKVLVGGRTDAAERYIEPTLLAEVDPAAPVMQEEIFGPVLPMRTFERIDEAVEFVTGREKPLALYYFGPEATGLEVLRRTSSGGACLNDTIMHIANDQLPFGGVGNSGMGHYHGRESFEAFSHRRAVVITPKRFDLPFRYPPYKGFRWVKKIL
ncbi:MAG TPA: aldehyde dehydrogenase [Candidatus Alistipes intestinigallinarum]|uniref:Aldehyde dehydrogenase n=1 Tax=Candidatus Alistipes intestinigallinarum TaxID=2838440 RepID=A0A9D2CCK0_9BACT|nr:aldehyde dehydrogenase [Candidatus Alistipes intestinigallinarum]